MSVKIETLCFILFSAILLQTEAKTFKDFDYKVSDIHDLIKNNDLNCTDVISYFLERAIKYNPILHAITNFNNRALEEANKLDKYFFENNHKLIGRLHCIPILVKDNIDVAGEIFKRQN